MILADTSVWIEHFRFGMPAFAAQLDEGAIACHSIVIGELATGHLRQRAQTLSLLDQLPRVNECTFDEAMAFLEVHRLCGVGLGWNDIQLLAAAKLNQIPLWSKDQRLSGIAAKLKVNYEI